MSRYTFITTNGTHSLNNFMWHWCGQDKWLVKNISAWHWESFLGFTCLGFYLKRCPTYSIKGWEAVSLNFRSLESRHCRHLFSRIRYYYRSCCRHRRFSTIVARHRWWSPTFTRHRNHSHSKSPLYKWVH